MRMSPQRREEEKEDKGRLKSESLLGTWLQHLGQLWWDQGAKAVQIHLRTENSAILGGIWLGSDHSAGQKTLAGIGPFQPCAYCPKSSCAQQSRQVPGAGMPATGPFCSLCPPVTSYQESNKM